MPTAAGIDVQCFLDAAMVIFAFAPLLVTLGECLLADAADAVTVPEGHDKVYPFLVAVRTLRAGEQFVHAGKGLVGQRNEIVLQRYFRFHVDVVLAAAQLQLLSNCIHSSMFSQIDPVVKTILGDFQGIRFVGFDLADRTSAALLDVKRIQNTNVNTICTQRRCNGFVITSGCLHDNAGIFT